MMACVARNVALLLKLMKYNVVVLDVVCILFNFNSIYILRPNEAACYLGHSTQVILHAKLSFPVISQVTQACHFLVTVLLIHKTFFTTTDISSSIVS